MAGVFRAVRPLVFTLDAERAHWLTVQSLARMPRLSTFWAGAPVEDPVTLLGLRFRNRVGLAAGMDKNAEAVAAFARLGFGFVEVGTVTPRPQPGNPKPRLFRAPEQGAVINRLGFNNDGVDACVARLEALRRGEDRRGGDALDGLVIGVNIGKNRDTPVARAADDYRHCLERAHAVADYITVNVSSPNTPGLRDLQAVTQIRALLAALTPVRDALADRQGRRAPMLLKLAPDMAETDARATATAALEEGIDGFIASNTTITRPSGLPSAFAAEDGGLSGRPLAALATALLRVLRSEAGPEVPIIAVGGIDSEAAGQQRVAAGADLLQIYTGLVYEGPSLPRRLAAALAASRLRQGI